MRNVDAAGQAAKLMPQKKKSCSVFPPLLQSLSAPDWSEQNGNGGHLVAELGHDAL